MTPQQEAILHSASKNISVYVVEHNGGSFEVTDTQLIARFPKTKTPIQLANATLGMTFLDEDNEYIVQPNVEEDKETGEFLLKAQKATASGCG